MLDINATLIGQMITFVVFVVFTMKFVWPPITKALADREKRIADGLAAAEKGQHSLELATAKSVELLQDAKNTAAQIIEQANSRALRIIEESKQSAREEGDKLIAHAQGEIQQQALKAQQELQKQTVNLALTMAEKLVQHEVSPQTHKQWLEQMASDMTMTDLR